jgi:hypothetical protein
MLELGAGAVIGKRHAINEYVDTAPWLMKLCKNITVISAS